MINDCNLGLVLMTKHGHNSSFVHQELGYLKAKGIPRLLVIEKGVIEKFGGFDYGHDFIEFDPGDMELAIRKVELMLRKYNLKLIKEEQRNNFIGISVLAVIFLYAVANSD